MTNFDAHAHYRQICKTIETWEHYGLGQALNHADYPQQLKALAQHMHTPPRELERALAEWAGLHAEQFFQCMQKDHARNLISAGGNFHHPGLKFKANALKGTFTIGQAQSPFGAAFICLTQEGLSNLEFETDQLNYANWRKAMHLQYPNANFVESHTATAAIAKQVFFDSNSTPLNVALHPRGTPFQLQVWEALTRLPQGQLASYQQLAKYIGKPTASRAVGSAVAKNPIAFFIPCHRVIQASGNFGQYHWQTTRKKAMHLWEQGRASLLN